MATPRPPFKPTPAETPKAKAATPTAPTAVSLRMQYIGGGDWELIEDTWASPPTNSRVVKRGPRSVLGDFARLWHEEYMGTGRTGKLPL